MFWDLLNTIWLFLEIVYLHVTQILLLFYLKNLLLLGQIFKLESVIDLDGLRSSEPENHIFSRWSLCVRVHVHVCVCINIAQKQIMAETPFSPYISYVDAASNFSLRSNL